MLMQSYDNAEEQPSETNKPVSDAGKRIKFEITHGVNKHTKQYCFFYHPMLDDKKEMRRVTIAALKAASGYRSRETICFDPNYISMASQYLSKIEKDVLFKYMNYLKYKAYQLRLSKLKYARKLLKQSDEIRNVIAMSNIRLAINLVGNISHKYPTLTFAELAAEAKAVTLKAIGFFDPFRGLQFSTYLSTCMFSRISQFYKKHTKIANREQLVLDKIIESNEDFCKDNRKNPTEEENSLIIRKQYIDRIMSSLTSQQQEVLNRRFGLLTGKAESTATILNSVKNPVTNKRYCRANIFLIEKNALAQLKKIVANNKELMKLGEDLLESD